MHMFVLDGVNAEKWIVLMVWTLNWEHCMKRRVHYDATEKPFAGINLLHPAHACEGSLKFHFVFSLYL